MASNLHLKWTSLLGFFFFKLFLCSPDVKMQKHFQGLCHMKSHQSYEPAAELTAPPNPHPHLKMISRSFFMKQNNRKLNLCSKTDTSKTAWINAWNRNSGFTCTSSNFLWYLFLLITKLPPPPKKKKVFRWAQTYLTEKYHIHNSNLLSFVQVVVHDVETARENRSSPPPNHSGGR